MSAPTKPFRVVSAEDLAANHKKQRTIKIRVSLSLLLAVLGLLLMAVSTFPLIMNKAIPLYWLHEANTNGFTKGLQDELMRLLANGRISSAPPVFTWVTGVFGTVLIWLSCLLFMHRQSPKWHGGAMNLSYWKTFYAFKKSQVSHTVIKGQKPTNTQKKKVAS